MDTNHTAKRRFINSQCQTKQQHPKIQSCDVLKLAFFEATQHRPVWKLTFTQHCVTPVLITNTETRQTRCFNPCGSAKTQITKDT